MRPRFVISILFLAILLLTARILIDAPTGRNKVSGLFPTSMSGEADHAIHRAIAIDNSTWSRAETVTTQALILGGLGLLGTAAAFYLSGERQASRSGAPPDPNKNAEQGSDGDA